MLSSQLAMATCHLVMPSGLMRRKCARVLKKLLKLADKLDTMAIATPRLIRKGALRFWVRSQSNGLSEILAPFESIGTHPFRLGYRMSIMFHSTTIYTAQYSGICRMYLG